MAKIELGGKEFVCSDEAFVMLSSAYLEAVVHRDIIPFLALSFIDEQSLVSFTDSFADFVYDFVSKDVCSDDNSK